MVAFRLLEVSCRFSLKVSVLSHPGNSCGLSPPAFPRLSPHDISQDTHMHCSTRLPLSCFTLRLDCLRPGMFPCLSLHLSQWPASFYAWGSISHLHLQLRSLFWDSDSPGWLESSAWMSHREAKPNRFLTHSGSPLISWPSLFVAIPLVCLFFTTKSSTNPVNSMSTYHLFMSLWFPITHQ